MTAVAGQTLEAGRSPGERIETAIGTANSAGFTAETVIDSVTAPLVTGRTYRVRWVTSINSNVVNNQNQCLIREDDLAGAVLNAELMQTLSTNSNGWPCTVEGEHIAVATGDKTFVATCLRAVGTGTNVAVGTPTHPRYLYVDYIRG